MAIKVSVVIPCYNMGKYVLDAMESVLSYPDQDIIEVVIVNDGSDDKGFTEQVLDDISIDNVKVIHQINKGLGNARNTGISSSRGEYILLLDADNKIRPEYIDFGISIMEKDQDIGLLYGDLKNFGESSNHVEVGELNISKLLVKNYIDACVILRKKAWESIKGYDENMPVMGYEDWDLNLRLFFKGWKFEYIKKILFDYRVRTNSMLTTSNKNRELLLEYIFSKPDLQQAKILRDKILGNEYYKTSLEQLKKRKMIALALRIERPVKKFYRLIRGL